MVSSSSATTSLHNKTADEYQLKLSCEPFLSWYRAYSRQNQMEHYLSTLFCFSIFQLVLKRLVIIYPNDIFNEK